MTAIGLGAWFAGLVLLPAPVAARIFLAAPLVIVPRLATILPARTLIGGRGGWPLLLAALPLALAFGLPPGPSAGAASLPWLGCAIVGLAVGVRHGLMRVRALTLPNDLPDVGIDAALGFWAVGAVFATLDRLGVETGFSPAIMLLTAIHFHFAGFGLLAISSLLAKDRRWLSVPVAGLIVGIPLTALGFVVELSLVNATGATVVGLSGIGVAIALLSAPITLPSDRGLRLAGALLLVGMPMGIAWSIAILAGQAFLDLDTMVRTHGALNSMAVLIVVLRKRAVA